MEEIRTMPKPDWISWDDIHELLMAAHKKNIAKGMAMKIPQLSGEELKQKIGEKGRCFVALANEKLVGTTSVSFYQGKSWYDKDKLVAHSMLSAVLPKYQGIGITDDLNVLRDAYIREMGVDLIQGDTAEDNLVVRKNAKRNGFHEVEYHAYQSNHYSVLFVKWLNGCPFSEKYISRRCKISKFLVKTQYKPGRIERSRLLSMFCNAIRKIVF